MDASAEEAISLQNEDGIEIDITNALDVTGKILTITPESDLEADTGYTLVIEAAADIYGQTLSKEIAFTTA